MCMAFLGPFYCFSCSLVITGWMTSCHMETFKAQLRWNFIAQSIRDIIMNHTGRNPLRKKWERNMFLFQSTAAPIDHNAMQTARHVPELTHLFCCCLCADTDPSLYHLHYLQRGNRIGLQMGNHNVCVNICGEKHVCTRVQDSDCVSPRLTARSWWMSGAKINTPICPTLWWIKYNSEIRFLKVCIKSAELWVPRIKKNISKWRSVEFYI